MRFPLTVGVLVACGLTVAAPIPKEKDKPKKDEDAIQGVWLLEKFEGGPALPVPPGVQMIRFTFKDGKLDVSQPGQPQGQQGTYKLDPTAKPKSIDLTEGGNGRTTLGIYELDGETLKICLVDGQAAVRPAEFKPDGKQVTVVTFRRMKEDKREK